MTTLRIFYSFHEDSVQQSFRFYEFFCEPSTNCFYVTVYIDFAAKLVGDQNSGRWWIE